MAYFLSETYGESDMVIFFTAIKEKYGQLQTDLFMSDMFMGFYNALVSVFTREAVNHQAVCGFHVSKAWNKHLQKIAEDHRSKLRSLLKSIKEETSVELFVEKSAILSKYMKDHEDVDNGIKKLNS